MIVEDSMQKLARPSYAGNKTVCGDFGRKKTAPVVKKKALATSVYTLLLFDINAIIKDR